MTVTARLPVPLPREGREPRDALNCVHPATLRADGSPRSHGVRVGVDGEHGLVCTSDTTGKAKDMRRDPRVSLPVVDSANPSPMAGRRGRVLGERSDHDGRYTDPIGIAYTSAPSPSRSADRICCVIGVEEAAARGRRPPSPRTSPVRRSHLMTGAGAPGRIGDEMPWTTDEAT
ncbi:pyridoxamine 5'-phosphate oxidase family protein [Geodermatophilus sp. SYSU D01062]